MNNEATKNRLWQVGVTVGILLAIFLAILSIKELKSIAYVGKDTPIMNSITVSGKGETVSIPDIATFSFGVTETAKLVNEAQDKATTKINVALKALKDNGVEDKDIKTLAYNINPRYEYMGEGYTGGIYRPGKQTLAGYEVSQTIEVKVRDIKKAGALFATIGSLEVQNVNGLTFSIDNIDNVKAEAQKIAITDAQAKAEKLAKQLGVKLVRIMSFYDRSDQPEYRYGYGGDMMVKEALSAGSPQVAPAVPAGEQKVTSNVSITYEIR